MSRAAEVRAKKREGGRGMKEGGGEGKIGKCIRNFAYNCCHNATSRQQKTITIIIIIIMLVFIEYQMVERKT